MTKFNLDKINKELFESETQDLDKYLDEPKNKTEIIEESEVYTSIDYPIKLWTVVENECSYWVAEHPDLPGCKAHGKSKEEALARLDEVKAGWIYAKLCDKEEIPTPKSNEEINKYSGRILLRLPKELHCRLSEKASNNNTSLNQEILYLISYALGDCNNQGEIQAQIDEIRDLIRANSIQSELTLNWVMAKYVEEKGSYEEYLNDYDLDFKDDKGVGKSIGRVVRGIGEDYMLDKYILS